MSATTSMEEIAKKLEDTFKDVIDITEPGNMDKILTILEQTRMEDDEYMEILVSKLQNEEVTWDQPWYQRSYCLTRKPPPPEDGVEAYATGPFSLEEGELIDKNWQNFVWEYDVPNTPICLARWRNRGKTRNANRCPEERVRNFVTAYLAQGLQRNLYQVNRYFLLHYGNPVKLKHYTIIEEKVMEICFYHRPQVAGTILSAVLGREPRGIYKKLIEYYNGKPDKKQKIRWTLELATKLVRLLMENSGCTFEELKHKEFDQSVWMKVGEELGQQYKYIHAFWYGTLHVQLFAKCAIKTKSLRKIICKKLWQSPYRIWSDIRWKELALEFPDGFTHAFLYKIAHVLFRKYPDYLTSPLMRVLAQAHEDPRQRRRKQLKTIEFTKKGKLKYAMHDTPLKQLCKSGPK